jgi:molybdenum cofactor synthesis domain-containing protein
VIRYDDAVATILGDVSVLPSQMVPLIEADGRVLASEVKAKLDLPRFDQSAMDGIGVRASDLKGASPKSPRSLSLTGEMPAGVGQRLKLGKMSAVKVFTGGMLPSGADAVVMKEDCCFENGMVTVTQAPSAGAHIRCRGEELQRGMPLLPTGTAVTPAVIGLLAANGITSVRVTRQPRVTLITMGDELLQQGECLTQGKIHDANGPALMAALHRSGVASAEHRYVSDDEDALLAVMKQAQRDSDLVITVGGASVGDYDHVNAVRQRLRVNERFSRVAIKPGKPNVFGVAKNGTIMFGLPGNPVSALVSFLLFVRPALRAMQGYTAKDQLNPRAVLDTPMFKKQGRLEWVRGTVRTEGDDLIATPTQGQGSHMLSGLAAANVLIEFPADLAGINAGERVLVHLLGW